MKKNFDIKKIVIPIFLLMFGMMTVSGFAQEMPVPVNLQAALFKKIFAFDKTLQSKGNVEVAVLTGSGSGDDIVSAFKAAGVNVKAVSGDQVPDGVSVVYVMPGVKPPKQVCSQKGVLSISGVPSYAETGGVSVALSVENGKPQISINMKELKAEGQDMSADLLRLAKIIQ